MHWYIGVSSSRLILLYPVFATGSHESFAVHPVPFAPSLIAEMILQNQNKAPILQMDHSFSGPAST